MISIKIFIQNIFSIKNSPNRKHKVITILGIKFKFKRKDYIKPIDIVYLWCDGNDEDYKKRKLECQRKQNIPISEFAINPCRYIDNDELKYSLRSLEKYANWINNIYIVTNGQSPKWLNTNHPRIKLINQSEIMTKSAIPNFNSNAIEHCLVNIPNLSEYFLYGNDDNFFFDYVTPEFFFKNKKPIYRFNQEYQVKDLYTQFLYNSEELIYLKYGKKYNRYPHHNIEPYRKSILKKCYKTFKKEIDKTINSPFRCETDIQKSIYASYALATNQGICKVQSLKSKKRKSFVSNSHKKNIMDEIIKFQPTLLCINDCENTTDEDRIEVKKILKTLFPEKSKFEL